MDIEDLSYQQHICKPCNVEEIDRLSKVVFIEGHLDKVDDLILAILPLANIIYYKYIRYLDDREYSKEDLISDAILRVYQDITLRWDKYIHVESYFEYFSGILRIGMIDLVHKYHNYYIQDELDPESLTTEDTNIYDDIEMNIVKENIKRQIIHTAESIIKKRPVHTNLLLSILDCKYVSKKGLDSLSSRIRVLGISKKLFNFYCDHITYVYKLAYNYQYAMLGGKNKMISRISDTLDRFEDITYRILANNYYDSIIPEIYAEFGIDIARKFVKTFSGRSVQVPEYRNFCDDLLGGAVVSLAKGDKSNLYQIADDHHIPYRTLARMYDKAIKFDNVK